MAAFGPNVVPTKFEDEIVRQESFLTFSYMVRRNVFVGVWGGNDVGVLVLAFLTAFC